MVYEASARIRDPVYGCAGSIFQLQRQINELQTELAKTQAKLLNMQCEQSNLVTLICKELSQMPHPPINNFHPSLDDIFNIASLQSTYKSYDDLSDETTNVLEPLWT